MLENKTLDAVISVRKSNIIVLETFVGSFQEQYDLIWSVITWRRQNKQILNVLQGNFPAGLTILSK